MTTFLYSAAWLINLATLLAKGQRNTFFPLNNDTLRVKHTANFEITGDGSSANWNTCQWLNLSQERDSGVRYQTRVKMLYSDSGIYCLYSCEDNRITATLTEDFLDLWHEDVVEAFFWPDESETIYFEYELSPLNYELPILVPNNKGKFLGWRPWHYEGNRRIKHLIHVNKNGDAVTSWTAEFFIPYVLLKPLNNVPPQRGMSWRANFYRIDYDHGESSWEWQKVKTNFHDYEGFGFLLFE